MYTSTKGELALESRIRPAKENDWLAILAVLDQVQPDTKEANREWWRERQRFDARAHRRRHYVVEVTRPSGAVSLTAYAGIEEIEPTQFRLSLVIDPNQLSSLGEKLYAGLMTDLAELGATLVTASEPLYSPVCDFLRNKGFRDELRVPLAGGGEAVVMARQLR